MSNFLIDAFKEYGVIPLQANSQSGLLQYPPYPAYGGYGGYGAPGK